MNVTLTQISDPELWADAIGCVMEASDTELTIQIFESHWQDIDLLEVTEKYLAAWNTHFKPPTPRKPHHMNTINLTRGVTKDGSGLVNDGWIFA